LEELQVGDPTQAGPYKLLGRLGAGGMGQVFLGRSPGGRLVAVKVIRPELAGDPGFRARFAREVAAARRVSGVFTAPVVDADPAAPLPWLATGFVNGPSLAQAVADHGPLPVASVLALAAGLAEGLGAVHAAGVVHRDLKPSNVLLAQDGPRVIDFGISQAADATQVTRTGTVIGSPSFMSPEQAEGHEVGPASDVFSLGSVLVFAATGDGPFGTGAPTALLYRVVWGTPRLDQVPGQVRPLVERCLAKDPAQRPTAGQFLAELTAAHPEAANLTDWLPASILPATRPPGPAGPPTPTEPPTVAASDVRNIRTADQPGVPGAGSGGGPGRRRPAPRPPRRVLAVVAAVMLLAIAGIVAAVLASSPSPTHNTTTGHSSSPAAHGSSSVLLAGATVCVTPVVSCTNAMQTKPAIITPSADGAVYVRALTWSDWGGATAVGSGTLERDNCQPSCANGTDVPYPVTVTLSDLTPYGDGEMAYAIMTISAPGNSYNQTFSKDLVP